jgi:hypothetical protein
MGWIVNGPTFDAFIRANLAKVGVIKQAVLVEFVLNICERELGAPDRNVQFGKHPGQRPDVIFVAMREKDAANFVPVLGEVGNIGDDNIDAQQFGFGEHEAGVDDNNVICPTNRHAVHSELAESAERYDLQFSGWHEESITMLAHARDAFVCTPCQLVCLG